MTREPGIFLSKALVRSPVWKGLTKTSMIVYEELRCRCQIKKTPGRRNGRRTGNDFTILNNGNLIFTYAEAAKMDPPIKPGAFRLAIDQLVDRGFIDITHPGGATKQGDPSRYAISERWQKHGKADFEKRPRQPDRRSGRGFKAMWIMRHVQSTLRKSDTDMAPLYQKTDTDMLKPNVVCIKKLIQRNDVKNGNMLISGINSPKTPKAQVCIKKLICSQDLQALGHIDLIYQGGLGVHKF